MTPPVCAWFAGPRPLSLADITLPPTLRVAVAGPHPDDFDCIAVALRILHANGNPIDLAVLTAGISGVDDGFAGAKTAEEKAGVREAEQLASCALFGLPPESLIFLRLAADAAGTLATSVENEEAIRAFFGRARPDIIFLPHGRDTNVAHQRTHALVTRIVAQDGMTVLLAFNQDPKTVDMGRDLVATFDDADAAWKRALLRTHASQQSRNLRARGQGLDDRILEMNRRAAESLGGNAVFAEVFELACYDCGAIAHQVA